MSVLNVERFRTMLATALDTVRQRADEFSALDAVAGDGDHGTAIVQALSAANRVAQTGTDLKTMLADMGFAAMTESSGSTSTLIGAFFLGLSEGVGSAELDAAATAAMFAAGLASVQRQTKATVGDRTLMDALIPAVAAMPARVGDGIQSLLDAAAQAAAAGAEQTKPLVARFGRARNLGTRVIGHADAGASSMACLLAAFARGYALSISDTLLRG
jgi:dihydroxyacetone kinase-like protein